MKDGRARSRLKEKGRKSSPVSLWLRAGELLHRRSAVNNALLSGWPCSLHLSHAYCMRERAIYMLEITGLIYVNIVVRVRGNAGPKETLDTLKVDEM